MVMYGGSKVDNEPELALDKPDELGFCDAYRKLGDTPEGTVRLFERPDFYTAHGTDAEFVAREVYRTTSVLKYLGARSAKDGPTPGLPSCTLSRAVAQSFLREALTTKQLRIEIYSNGNKKGTPWKVVKTASPGNLQDVEDLLFANSDIMEAPVLMSIKLTVKDAIKTCGIAFVDTSIRSLGVTEFVDNELFSNTEALLIQLGVKEVILPTGEKSTGYEFEKLRQVIDRCNIVVTERKKVDFQAKNIEQDLNRLLSGDATAETLPELDMRSAMSATAAVIAYLGLLGDESNHQAYTLKHHDLSQFMRLDASALRALHLMPDPNGVGGSGKNMSLFGLLNKCKTSQGSRLLNQWLKQPLINLHEIKKRQDLVEGFVDDFELRVAMQDGLKKMPDLHRLSKRFKKGVASLQDVVRVYQAILELPTFVEGITGAAEDNERLHGLYLEVYGNPFRKSAENLKPYSDLVETTVDLKELDNHNYVIKAEYDTELGAIKERLTQVRDSLDEQHATVAAALGFETDNKTLHFEVNQVYGHCFRLTRKESSAIRGKKGYIELGNRNNGVFFTTSALRQLAQDFKDLTTKYERKQSSLVKEVISIAASYAEVLEPLNNDLANLDVIVSFAHVASSAASPYVKPTMHPKGEGSLTLREGRHACLEVQDDVNFIANDVDMIRGEHELTILSGPNMCGKSTYIRQVGCIALLAQIGSFVPCTSAELPIFDMILCRVGAGDSQLKGVSTFMAEMLETATILKSATKDSLVIVDELGRGTSTYDGFGLAWAISEHIATEIRAFTLFATHFHELSGLALQVPTVKNLHVMAHVEDRPGSVTGKDIVLLYKVAEGACDKSFGLNVAELAHFPVEVIKHAKRKADELEDFGAEASALPEVAPEVAAEGVAIVRQLCEQWAAGEDGASGMDLDVETRNVESFKRLKTCFDEARSELEANEWVQRIVPSL